MAESLLDLLVLSFVLCMAPPADAEPARVAMLLERARAQLSEGETAEALKLIDQTLLLEPESGWARALRSVVDDEVGGEVSPADRAAALRLIDGKLAVEYQGAELGMVVSELQRRVGVTVFVDWHALERIGIQCDDHVTLRRGERCAAQVLDEIVRLVGDEATPRWRVLNSQVAVSAPKALRDRTWTVVYDVRDLVRNEIGGEGEDEANAAERVAVARILDRLRVEIDPDGWQSRGGDRNWVRSLRGNLIITSTPWNHRAIESTLVRLREQRAREDLGAGRLPVEVQSR